MSKLAQVILDHEEKWEIEQHHVQQLTNEINSLANLMQGMDLLAYQVQKCEVVMHERLDPTLKYSISGNSPQLEGISIVLLQCFFDWYAVSACKYVKLIGKIAVYHNITNERADDYMKRIIPNIIMYRDKIGSKFCYTSHNKQDNTAEKIFSVMPQLTFEDNTFVVGAWKFATRGSNTQSIKSWSITETHNMLKKRYNGFN